MFDPIEIAAIVARSRSTNSWIEGEVWGGIGLRSLGTEHHPLLG